MTAGRIRVPQIFTCSPQCVESLAIDVRRVLFKDLGDVKRQRLDLLANEPFYTKGFAYYVGRRCRQATIGEIAQELNLDGDTIKTLEK